MFFRLDPHPPFCSNFGVRYNDPVYPNASKTWLIVQEEMYNEAYKYSVTAKSKSPLKDITTLEVVSAHIHSQKHTQRQKLLPGQKNSQSYPK